MLQHQIEEFCLMNIEKGIEITFLDNSTMFGNALESNNILYFSDENSWLLKRQNKPNFYFYGGDIIEIKICCNCEFCS